MLREEMSYGWNTGSAYKLPNLLRLEGNSPQIYPLGSRARKFQNDFPQHFGFGRESERKSMNLWWAHKLHPNRNIEKRSRNLNEMKM